MKKILLLVLLGLSAAVLARRGPCTMSLQV